MLTKKIQPLDPDCLIRAKVFEIPDIVIMIVNQLIDSNWDGYKSKIWQSELLTRIERMTGLDKKTILHNHWLDIEPTYRRAGYEVKYVAPQWGEKGDAYFEFAPTTYNEDRLIY